MTLNRLKLFQIGVVLNMVLGVVGHPFDMPCYASAESAREEAALEDPEDQEYTGHAAKVRVEFIKGFNSALVIGGETVIAKLMEDLRMTNGGMLAPKGSKMYGRVELVNRSKSLTQSARTKGERFHRHASVVVRFDKVVTPQKAKLEITGTAAPQHLIFSNGETVRVMMVGGGGEVLKTENTDYGGLPELGLMVPKDWLKLRGRYEVDVIPGDEMLVHVDLGQHGNVQGEIVGGRESNTH